MRKKSHKKGGKKWIAGAIKRPGAFSAKAKRAGMSTQEYARKERHAPGRLGREARLALTLSKFHHKGKKSKKRGKK